MVFLKPSYRHYAAVLLTALLAAWTASCTTLDDLTAPTCVLALSSSSAAFDNRGGAGTLAVHTASSCAWAVTSNDAWVAFTTPTSGNGDASIAYTVAANTGAPARSATLNVSGQSFTVSQSGVQTSCTYAAAPSSAAFPAAGGSGTVTVTTSSGCPWSAAGQPNWITITSGSSGAGNGVVKYAVTANKSKNSRSGAVSVAGRTVTISQAGEGK